MPKGEHFKKPNPRINQVSFKVNDKELKKLQTLASDKDMSIPEWIRLQINLGVEIVKKEEVIPSSVPSDIKKNDDDVAENQMSLF